MESYIYHLIDRYRLTEILDAFYGCIGIPIQVLDETGTVTLKRGEDCGYCAGIRKALKDEEACKRMHAVAGHRAMALGEAYIFSCHANLIHIVFPLVNDEKLFGSILAGPFLLSEPESSMILELGRRHPDWSTETMMELYDDTSGIPVIEPARVTQISRLIYYLFSHLLLDSREQFILNREKVEQQARIGESIQMYKTQEKTVSAEYPFEKERELLTRVKEGDISRARAVLNDILGYVFFAGGNDLSTLKYRSIELCSMLTRTAVECGASAKNAFAIGSDFIGRLGEYKTTEEMCFALEKVLFACMNCLFPGTGAGNGKLLREAREYVAAHFFEKLTLRETAERFFLNPSYFSRVFRKGTGMTFTDYVTTVRLEEAKRLLTNTDTPLVDIALAVGIDNQSYFSRIFRERTGMTPTDYRNL